MGKPRILVIENGLRVTGGVNAILRSSLGLKEEFEFVFLFPMKSESKKLVEHHGFITYELPMKELSRGLGATLRYIPVLVKNTILLSRLVKKIRPNLIVSNDIYNLLPPFYRLFRGKVNYVVFVRFLPSKFSAVLTNVWFFFHKMFALRVIAVSNAVKNEIPFSKGVEVIGGELPLQQWTFRSATSRTILFVGNYIEGKGQQYAVQAFAKVHQKLDGWNLRFVGSDMGLEKNRKYKQSVIALAKNLGISEKTCWSDFSTEPSNEYVESDFTLNFSESESFSLTTLEAQFYGRPVIVTRCGGPEEIVVDGETGILVPIKDIDSMAKAIEYLITHPEIRQQMGARAYVHVREKFSYENTIGKLAQIYREAIETIR